jgi:hypothetical protein
MGISSRCNGFNLYNHLKQKQVNITHTFILLKNVNNLESMSNDVLNLEDYKKDNSAWSYIDKNLWLCIVTVDNNQILAIGKTKKDSLLTILYRQQEYLYSLVN